MRPRAERNPCCRGYPRWRRLSSRMSQSLRRPCPSRELLRYALALVRLLRRRLLSPRFPQRLSLRDLRRQAGLRVFTGLPQQHLHLGHHLRLALALVVRLTDCGRLQFALASRDAEELMDIIPAHAQAARVRVALGDRPEALPGLRIALWRLVDLFRDLLRLQDAGTALEVRLLPDLRPAAPPPPRPPPA